MSSKKSEFPFYQKNTQNSFAYNSATKYCSEAVLYSKQAARYPLSLDIKTIAVAFLRAEAAFWKIEKNTQLQVCGTHPF